ncbi:MAG TPA: phosphoglycolate phosphatase [Steroidobacteraceae bacterium]|jgi:2-phosphoglycolate phosphatase|nr:phosphoglycolate phosphatase [Steroidobacteraceae bacterium]
MMQAVRAVLFDLDGTLLDTAPDMVGALNALRHQERLPGLPFPQLRLLVSHGARALVHHGFPEAQGPRFESLRQRFLTLYAEALAVRTRPYAGVPEALAYLDSQAIPWGIVTNKPEGLTGPLLEKLGLTGRARTIVCGDTLPERKPHPRPLLHAAAQLGVHPGAAIYVGDAERDVLAAQAAGMRAYVALYGYIPADERPREWPANGWLDSSEGLVGWLQSLLRGA